jgi:hypothetical protein
MPAKKASAKKVALLSGGNPQIAKADGDEPVQAYIAAMPGWKQAIGRKLDKLIETAAPGVRKQVRYNTPFYGAKNDPHWAIGFHCFDRYVKVSFFRGVELDPMPPGPSKQAFVRYLDIHEEGFDEKQFSAWVKQAMKLPGVKL